MKIYKKEKSIADKILNDVRVTYAATILQDNERAVEVKANIKNNLLNQINLVCADMQTPPPLFSYWKSCLECDDVYPLSSILVSSINNKNDDCFSGGELIKAFKSASFKPINWEHQGSEFRGNQNIGVMVYPSLQKGTDPQNLSSLEEEEYPSWMEDTSGQIHIRQDGILWGFYFPTYVDKVETSLNLFNNLCVSMECFFDDFGYALIDSEGNCKLINRTERNANYSFELKRYGGPGEIEVDGQKYKIARWLKDITFSGQGLTYTPANTKGLTKLSVILNNPIVGDDVASEKANDNAEILQKNDDSVYNNLTQTNASEIVIMAEPDNKIDELTAQLTALVTANSVLEEELVSLKENLAKAESALTNLVAENDVLRINLVEIEKKNQVLESQLTDMQLKETGNNRLAAMKSINVAVKFTAEQLSKLDNDAFDICLEACKLSQSIKASDSSATSVVADALNTLNTSNVSESVLVLASEETDNVLVAKELLTNLQNSKRANLNKKG